MERYYREGDRVRVTKYDGFDELVGQTGTVAGLVDPAMPFLFFVPDADGFDYPKGRDGGCPDGYSLLADEVELIEEAAV